MNAREQRDWVAREYRDNVEKLYFIVETKTAHWAKTYATAKATKSKVVQRTS